MLLAAIWLLVTATGALGRLAVDLSVRLPASVTLTATLIIPVLAGFCSLDWSIDWRVRIILFVVLLVCVPLLGAEFGRHPAVAVTIGAIFFVEEFFIIPLINKRWSRNTEPLI
jgi:hypothetical protein